MRVWLDLGQAAEPVPMRAVAGGWELALSRPPVDRLEYLFAHSWPDGAQAMSCDPTNPLRVTTPFGDHSVLEFPGYRAPTWLTATAPEGSTRSLTVRAPALGRPVALTVWSPHDGAGPLPLLLVHDGPEFARLAGLLRFAAAMIAAGRLPAFRVALLAPGDRNRWYAALPEYATALALTVLPALRRSVAVAGPLVLAGASLGALAALHAAASYPQAFGGLFLQSGSFFDAELDAHESSFGGFGAVSRFVTGLDAAPGPTVMTCGLGEENLANNRALATRLGVPLHEVTDAHTWTGWRDALDPALVGLLAARWG